MKVLMALSAGLLFGLGLIISGMSDPAKMLGFLDLAGKWDPSLAFVMGGAVLVGSFVFPFAGNRTRSLLGDPMRLQMAVRIDRRLVLGSLTFGVGGAWPDIARDDRPGSRRRSGKSTGCVHREAALQLQKRID